ncbi:MAG: sensor histidine kinase [Thiolinea sp.]
MSIHNGSLRTRLALWFGLVLLCGGGLLLLLAYNFAAQAADEAYDKLLASAALTAMENLTVSERTLNFDLPYASLATLALAPDDRVVYSLIDDLQHPERVLTGYANTPWPALSAMRDRHQQGKPYFYSANYDTESFRFVVLERELLESGVQGKVWLQMGQSQLARRELASDLTLKALLGIAGLVLLGGIGVWLAAGRSLKPLLKVENVLLQRKPTELNPLSTEVPKEIRHLIEAINRFMHRLQRNQDRNHAFIAEAAHQLRTPLASLQAQAELASEMTEDGVFRDRAERILRNAKETNSRINQLLNYATLAHRADVSMPENIDLAEIVTQCLGDMAPLALRSNVDLSFENQAGEVKLFADPEAIREMVRNLVDNALKYGQQGELKRAVHISLFRVMDTNHNIALQVRDYGPGLPQALLTEVTRRFGRGEFRQSIGSGLGLAIVEQLIHTMGGKLELENGIRGGLKARLLFDLVEPQ